MVIPFRGAIRSICLLLVSLVTPSLVSAQPISNEVARSALCKMLTRIHDSKGSGVWPGFDPLDAPLVARFSDDVVGYGSASYFAGWKTVDTGGCQAFIAPEGFVIPPSPMVLQLDVNGAEAFYFDLTIKPEITPNLLSALIHERFHRFQFEHFTLSPELINAAFTDHLDLELGATVYFESQKLIDYLKTGSDENLKDFLALAISVRDRHTGTSAFWEVNQVLFEGTASYIQLKAMELIEDEFRFGYRETWKEIMIDELSINRGVDGMIKWRHYGVGGALLSYLDSVSDDESWKTRIQENPLLPVYGMVANETGISDAEFATRSKALKESLDFKDHRSKAASDIQSYHSEISAQKDKLKAKRFTIRVIGPAGSSCKGGGFSDRTYYLANQGKIELGFSGMLICGSEAPDFAETHKEVDVLESLVPNGSIFGADTLSWNTDGVSGEGLPNAPIEFNRLTLKTETSSVEFNVPGVIRVVADELFVEAKNESPQAR